MAGDDRSAVVDLSGADFLKGDFFPVLIKERGDSIPRAIDLMIFRLCMSSCLFPKNKEKDRAGSRPENKNVPPESGTFYD